MFFLNMYALLDVLVILSNTLKKNTSKDCWIVQHGF